MGQAEGESPEIRGRVTKEAAENQAVFWRPSWTTVTGNVFDVGRYCAAGYKEPDIVRAPGKNRNRDADFMWQTL
ncbi:hypothetical protein AAFF_G00206450 [Aldrovandia affinis]|uniref:Uncharacterized protein n=1 Tax=Aldrovandia affinis TaxID=143900 RepID=A0AAD7RHK3_9TELE|nr:hypothetical protein AAFF_G00206450 [Aldrovandia affinis]